MIKQKALVAVKSVALGFGLFGQQFQLGFSLLFRQRWFRVLMMMAVVSTLVGIYGTTCATPKAHADGPAGSAGQNASVLTVRQAASDEILGPPEWRLPTYVVVDWNTQAGPRIIQMTVFLSEAGQYHPFEVYSSGGGWDLRGHDPRGRWYLGTRRASPFWAFVVALLQDGRLIVSEPVEINHAGIWDYTRPTANRFD